jgi:DHA1 family multidrug resistance protein-like MFS transporter
VLPVTMLFGTFAWQFVYVTLPFHVQAISPYDEPATLTWTGWILGISALVTVVTAPAWGRWAERGNPKTLYILVELLQGILFVGMALARTVVELFVARFVLGLVGAASTFAFVIAGRSATTTEVRREVAAVQSAMTIGQVIGPLAGALVAARVGFRASFVVGGVILMTCALTVWRLVPDPRPSSSPARRRSSSCPPSCRA